MQSHGSLPDSQMQTLLLHQQGLSIKEIAEKRNLRVETVIEHLIRLMQASQAVDINRLVAPERQNTIIQAIETIGDTSIPSIYKYLGQEYSDTEIKLVLAFWRQSRLAF